MADFEDSSPFRYLHIQIIFGMLYAAVFLGCIFGESYTDRIWGVRHFTFDSLVDKPADMHQLLPNAFYVILYLSLALKIKIWEYVFIFIIIC